MAACAGGYLEYVFRAAARELFGADVPPGPLPLRPLRNADLREVTLEVDGRPALRFAAAYGFRNIQTLARGPPVSPTRRVALPHRARANEACRVGGAAPCRRRRARSAQLWKWRVTLCGCVRRRARRPRSARRAGAQDQAARVRVRLRGGHGLPGRLPERRRATAARARPGRGAAAGPAGPAVP
jgi:hypothetical protein